MFSGVFSATKITCSRLSSGAPSALFVQENQFFSNKIRKPLCHMYVYAIRIARKYGNIMAKRPLTYILSECYIDH